ncbi:MAG: hypothetical protein DRJ06_00465 [Candidatus Aminicenantes bacterium]|nr:MAG: hypothetical protein DRJ06_00465 [Candidatus Aminicenantes bacterium]
MRKVKIKEKFHQKSPPFPPSSPHSYAFSIPERRAIPKTPITNPLSIIKSSSFFLLQEGG